MVVVLGGGLGGLSAAYYLLRRGVNGVQLFESGSRLGGWIKTDRNAEHGFLFEQGPRTIRPAGAPGANTLNLIDQLGISEEVVSVPKSHVAAKKRLIYVQNQLHELPSSLGGLFKFRKPFSAPLITALYRDFQTKTPPAKNQKDDSMYNFVERRFGKEIADYAISAMICGICAGDAKEISVKFLMKSLYELEQQHGGVIRGILGSAMKAKVPPMPIERSLLAKRAMNEKWFVYTIRGGLQTLIEALEDTTRQSGAEISLNEKVKQISFSHGKTEVELPSKTVATDRLVSSMPAHSLAPLVAKEHPQLSALLEQIKYVNVAVVNVQFSGTKVLNREGFGLLVPPCENLPILGVIFDSCCFDMGDNTVLTLMMGGHWFEKYFGEDPKEALFLNTTKKYLSQILGITEEPTSVKVNVLRKCIPQYTVGHYERVEAIRSYVAEKQLPLELCGAAFDGVGVNDVIMSASNVVDRMTAAGRN